MKLLKLTTILIFTVFSLTTLTSCYNDSPVSDSCLTLDKVADISQMIQAEVNSTVKTAFKLSNQCNYSIDVFEIKIIENIDNEFFLEDLQNNATITEDGLEFNIVFKPTSLGFKSFKFSITTIESTMAISIGAEAI